MKHLLADGHDVTVTGRGGHDSLENVLGAKRVFFDLRLAADTDFDRLIDQVDTIHYYAWTTIPQTANNDPLADLLHNVGPVVKLLEAMRRRGGGRVVFTSSGGTVYGKLRTVPVPETHILAPLTAYGVSKLSAETYFNFYSELHGIDARIVRVANPYGAGQNVVKGQGVISTLISRALRGQIIEIWGDGEVIRDFIYISDVVNGLALLAQADKISMKMPFVYNLGAGRGASINEVIAAIEKGVRRKLNIARRAARPFDVPVSVLDISKIRSEFDWRPRVTLDDGIRYMVEDLIRNPECKFATP
ncbi:NAD-dependent epimerase/dehydratase family protein [Rhizobium sp. CG4]|nr:NAD-dependent epimerase/dehydratase family protein [Rhizobium sp. CG4]